MKIRIVLSLFIVFALFGCSNKSKKTSIIDLNNLKSNEGWVDIPLSMSNVKDLNNYIEYTARAIFNKDTLGIIVRLKKEIPSGIVNGKPKNMFLEKGIEFISNGKESDRLLMYMALKYDLEESDIKMKKNQIFTCANLNQTKPNYKDGESKFKIFLENEPDYAELFVNFDFSKKVISLNEKDTEYRNPLVRLLSE